MLRYYFPYLEKKSKKCIRGLLTLMFKVIMNKEKIIELANIKNTQNPKKEEEKKSKTEKETKIG